MSEHQWAPIVYGRSYHLDFRFIAIPKDFTQQEVTWALPYILATTRKANKLSLHPRWSLFKNESHCIVGVTCMVRDLIAQLGTDLVNLLAKDESDRPLYIFVGYVTTLNKRKYLLELPTYLGKDLQDFASLYKYVQQVWWVKNYDKDSKKAIYTDYQIIDFIQGQVVECSSNNLTLQINHQSKYPQKVFLWQNLPENNSKLWQITAGSQFNTSVCLGDNHKYSIFQSPFLNATISEIEKFTILEKAKTRDDKKEKTSHIPRSSLSTIIANRAKEDLELTIKYASKATELSHKIISRKNQAAEISDSSKIIKNNKSKNQKNDHMIRHHNQDEFGFQFKKNTSNNEEWFEG